MNSLEKMIQLASEAAREAGALQKKSLGKVKNIEFKGDINLVTEVDKACEKLIIEKIQKAYPDHDILAEESGVSGSQSLASGADIRWIIDPLDGTTNYAHTYPFFCVSIGIERQGKLTAGIVYDPIADELFTAIRGQGAFLNGNPIAVSKNETLKRSLVCTGFAYNVHEAEVDNLDHFTNFIKTAQAVRRDGTAALDICYVACGRYDGFWEMSLWPWDMAAAVVILEEAGGTVSMFRGTPFDVYGHEILSSNGLIHEEMIKTLAQGKLGPEGRRREELF
jgi:myo-inositol-1(or 4)-monophosphatase